MKIIMIVTVEINQDLLIPVNAIIKGATIKYAGVGADSFGKKIPDPG